MTTHRRVRANRTNAQASTGPKTAAGKARSARNSLRHGFNIPVTADSALAPEMEALAQRIAGEGVDGPALECARRIAEAEFDLQRVRALRLRLSGDALASLGSTSTLKPQKSLEDLFAVWKEVSALEAMSAVPSPGASSPYGLRTTPRGRADRWGYKLPAPEAFIPAFAARAAPQSRLAASPAQAEWPTMN